MELKTADVYIRPTLLHTQLK